MNINSRFLNKNQSQFEFYKREFHKKFQSRFLKILHRKYYYISNLQNNKNKLWWKNYVLNHINRFVVLVVFYVFISITFLTLIDKYKHTQMINNRKSLFTLSNKVNNSNKLEKKT